MGAPRIVTNGGFEPWRQPQPAHRRQQIHGKLRPMAGDEIPLVRWGRANARWLPLKAAAAAALFFAIVYTVGSA